MPSPPPTLERLREMRPEAAEELALWHSMALFALAGACEGLSGRALRKMPFLAQALFIDGSGPAGAAATLDGYIGALHQTIQYEAAARQTLQH